MKVINLFGAPGAGKSTTAAGLFHLMKLKKFNCELVTEYAKEMVWRGLPHSAFQDQLYITAKQNMRLEVLRDKVDFVITDSPLLLGCVYASTDYYCGYKNLVESIFNSYNNINFFVNRVKDYNPVGRNQTEGESDFISSEVKNFLDCSNYLYTVVDGDEHAPLKILNTIINGP